MRCGRCLSSAAASKQQQHRWACSSSLGMRRTAGPKEHGCSDAGCEREAARCTNVYKLVSKPTIAADWGRRCARRRLGGGRRLGPIQSGSWARHLANRWRPQAAHDSFRAFAAFLEVAGAGGIRATECSCRLADVEPGGVWGEGGVW